MSEGSPAPLWVLDLILDPVLDQNQQPSLTLFSTHALILTAKAEPVASPERAAMSEEEVERRSRSIIDEFLHINDYKVPECLTHQQLWGSKVVCWETKGGVPK